MRCITGFLLLAARSGRLVWINSAWLTGLFFLWFVVAFVVIVNGGNILLLCLSSLSRWFGGVCVM